MSLPLPDYNISPQEAFGPLTTLAESMSVSEANHSVYGFGFQMIVLMVGFVYVFFIVRYWDFLRYFILNALGFFRGSKDKAHINPAEQTNIEVVMILLGIITLSLCTLRIGREWNLFPPSVNMWFVTGAGFIAITIALLFQLGGIYLCSAVCENVGAGKALIGLKSLYLAVCFVAIIPFGTMFLLSPTLFSTVGFWGMVVSMIIALIIFVKESFLFFVWQKISILHWILYLCALEIFPLSLILAPIVR